MNYVAENREKNINVLYLALFSHFVYYYNFIIIIDSFLKLIVFLTAIISMVMGFVLTKRQKPKVEFRIDYKKLFNLGLLMVIISLFAHVYFYSGVLNNLSSYGDIYRYSSSKGYITVFFEWMPLGLLLMLHSAVKAKSKMKTFLVCTLILFFGVFYLFILMKRRQLLLLVFGVLLLFQNKKIFKRKFTLLVLGFTVYSILMIAGEVRGVYQIYGLEYTLSYIQENFNLDWIMLSSTEGQAASMILNDVINYVSINGINLEPFIGAISAYMPSSLFGVKYSSFPTWYTSTFHPEIFQAGFAGSIIAELYLYFSFPSVIFGYFLLGYILKKVHATKLYNLYALYALFLYLMLILPRLDLASLIIMTIFQIIPVLLIYLMSSKIIKIR